MVRFVPIGSEYINEKAKFYSRKAILGKSKMLESLVEKRGHLASLVEVSRGEAKIISTYQKEI
jgi:hypothetical protein